MFELKNTDLENVSQYPIGKLILTPCLKVFMIIDSLFFSAESCIAPRYLFLLEKFCLLEQNFYMT